MERFIFDPYEPATTPLQEFKIQYGEIYIGGRSYHPFCVIDLKSNMERFILCNMEKICKKCKNLKSNMERFIY